MKTIYLKEFEELAKRGVAYIPLGTIEWHGDHLPIETDFLIAQKICEELNKDFPGYILPPFYMGAYGHEVIDGQDMWGMDRKLKKKLLGNVYFLESDLLVKTINSLISNLKKQGFNKIIVVTGHGGGTQTDCLKEIAKNENVLTINPYDAIASHHADETETSIFWACFPQEEGRGRSFETPKDDDLTNHYGYDPLPKSSLKLGQELLAKMMVMVKEKCKHFLES